MNIECLALMLRSYWQIFTIFTNFLLRRKFASVNGHLLTHFSRRDVCAEKLTRQIFGNCVCVNARRTKSATYLRTSRVCVGLAYNSHSPMRMRILSPCVALYDNAENVCGAFKRAKEICRIRKKCVVKMSQCKGSIRTLACLLLIMRGMDCTTSKLAGEASIWLHTDSQSHATTHRFPSNSYIQGERGRCPNYRAEKMYNTKLR